MGHLRDLPKSKMGVDLEHDFEPDYQPLASKAAIISELRSASKAAKHIYLATDPDREGEAISWHLKELLELPDDKTERVTFNEITKNVVTRSIQEPRGIDYNLVDAQQARRILDRIVGYQLSPLLWKKIRRGLSAGRVQSVADASGRGAREGDPRPSCRRNTGRSTCCCADLIASRAASTAALSTARARRSASCTARRRPHEILRDIAGQEFAIAEAMKRRGKAPARRRRRSSPPRCSRRPPASSTMTPRRTMAVAQQLYEGVDISGRGHRRPHHLYAYRLPAPVRGGAGRGAVSLSPERYGPEYYPGQPRHFRKPRRARRTRTRPSAPAMSGSTPRAFKDRPDARSSTGCTS